MRTETLWLPAMPRSSGPNFFVMATMDMCKEYMDELIACLNTFEINSASGIGATAGGEQRFNAELGKDIAFDEYLSK